MIERPLIVISLDGLATSALGCYGSSWNKTPAIDAIASTGCVWDRWVATSDEPTSVLRETIETAVEWRDAWSPQGTVELLTDAASLINGLKNSCFDRVDTIANESPESSDIPVSDISDSQLGQLILAAIERDSRDDPWSVLWLHSNFLTRRWDAPRDLFPIDEIGEEMSGPSDEVELLDAQVGPNEAAEPPLPIFDTVLPPQIKLEDRHHPDLVTSWMRTYGCQIRMLDLLIEALLTSLYTEDPYVVLLGTSGFRLGQGGWIGHQTGPLRSPDIRLPLIVSDFGPLRVSGLTGSHALTGLLRDLRRPDRESLITPKEWSEGSRKTQVETRSRRAQYALTTPGWFFVRDHDSSEHLYLKPDDIEDFNDVGRLRSDVIRELGDSKK